MQHARSVTGAPENGTPRARRSPAAAPPETLARSQLFEARVAGRELRSGRRRGDGAAGTGFPATGPGGQSRTRRGGGSSQGSRCHLWAEPGNAQGPSSRLTCRGVGRARR